MKILHLLSQIPEATGSGIYLQALLRHAAQRGHENYLLAGIPADFPAAQKFSELHCCEHSVVRFDHELPFAVVGMSDVMPYPSTRFCDLSAADLHLYEECFSERLVESIERWQPDLIHSHHLWLLSSLTRQLFPQIPMLVSCHGSDLRQFVSCSHLRDVVLAGCRQVDAVCVLSKEQQLDVQQLYGISYDKIHRVGGGYDRGRFFPPREKSSGPLQILYAGKLSRAKGVAWLLQALNLLGDSEFIFHLVGDSEGVEKKEILQLANSLGPQICVHGALEQEQLAELMRQADLFVLPSFFEGLPLVLLEALACNCRVVSTALPGVCELFSGIESDWVELVPLPRMATIDEPLAADEELFIVSLRNALQKQLRQLRDERHCAFPEELQKRLDNYTWDAIFLKLEGLYGELLGK